jgi:hypothetical protein
MHRDQTSRHDRRGILGTALLIIGSAVLVAYSASLAWQVHVALNSTALDSLGFLGSLGLASLHAMRIMVLDHAVLLSVVHRMLVLCSALIVLLIGIALLPKRVPGKAAHGGGWDASTPAKGGQ